MSQSTHPSTELLAGYIDSPDSNEFGALIQHLINCTECRNKTMKLTKLNYNITHHLPRLLEPNEANELKSALHFATHSAAMNRHLNSATNKEFTQHFVQEVVQEGFQNNAPKPNDDSSAGFIEQITNFLTIRPPVWASVPVTAAIVFSLTMVLLPVSDKSDETDMSIATYQDNPVIIFNKSEQVIPGIGFFNNANQKKEAFNSISIALKKDSSLHIEWTPVANANSYIINLYLIDGSDKKLIGTMEAKTAKAVFLNSRLESGRRYEWLITGQTTDNLSFQTKGGFIVSSNIQ